MDTREQGAAVTQARAIVWVILRVSLLSARTSFCIQTETGKEAIYASFSNGKYLTDEKFSEPRLRLSKQTRQCQKKKKKAWLWTGLAKRFRKWPGMCILADYIHNSSNAMFYTEKGCTAELCFLKEKEIGLSPSPAGKRQGSCRRREVRSPVSWGQSQIT